MQPPSKDSQSRADSKPVNRPSLASQQPETKEDRDRQLIELLGEVIRMSQAWVSALESGNPFQAEEYEDKFVRAVERFDVNRKKAQAKRGSFDRTL